MYLFIVYMIEINWQTNITGNKDWPFLHVTVILYKRLVSIWKDYLSLQKRKNLAILLQMCKNQRKRKLCLVFFVFSRKYHKVFQIQISFWSLVPIHKWFGGHFSCSVTLLLFYSLVVLFYHWPGTATEDTASGWHSVSTFTCWKALLGADWRCLESEESMHTLNDTQHFCMHTSVLTLHTASQKHTWTLITLHGP